MSHPSEDPETHFIEQAGLVLERFGLPRTAGRIVGCLLLADPEHQSSRQLASRLGVSKGSISTSTRLLLASGSIERVGVAGTREDHFRLTEPGQDELFTDQIRRIGEVRLLAEEGLQLVGDKSQAVQDRMKAVHEFYGFLERELPGLLERWRRSR